MNHVPQDSCNIQGPETPRYSTSIISNPKHEVAHILRQKLNSQATYKKFLSNYKPSNLSHNKCVIVKILDFIQTESGARLYAPISSSWVKGCGGSILVKIAALCCTSLIFTCSDINVFVHPVLVHLHYAQRWSSVSDDVVYV